MDLATFHILLTPIGGRAIESAQALEPTEDSFLTALTRLQKEYPAELAKAALETVIFRRRAAAKFSRAADMYFTREGLEMASGETISRQRARRFAPFAQVADLCCGIGGDTIGLSMRSLTEAEVTSRGINSQTLLAVDFSPLHLALAEQNLRVYGGTAAFIQADLTRTSLPSADAYFFDPGRRQANKRAFSVRHYQPPLALIDSWLPKSLGVKISPGVKLDEIGHYDCEVEFISLDGDLKECVLWFGPLNTVRRRATLLSHSNPPVTLLPSNAPAPTPPLSPPGAYLYEPDPAILRAGLVADLAAQLNAAQLDPDIAYLTSDTLTPTPYARAFRITAALPFSQKRLRDQLRAMNVGRVTIKKRGSPLEPAALARSLKLKGDEEQIVFLTHVAGKPWALIGDLAR